MAASGVRTLKIITAARSRTPQQVQERTARCLDQEGNRSGFLRGVVGLLLLERDAFLFFQMCFDLLKRGPTLKVELQHLPGSLGRLASRPQDDEQAGDQGGIDLQGNAVLRRRQELLAAHNAFQPAEKQLHRPAITISQNNQFGREVEPVGKQPPRLQRPLVVGTLHLDQPQVVVLELVLVVRRAQAFDPLIADDAYRTVRCGQGVPQLRRIRGVVLDASNKRRARFEDFPVESVIEVAAVNDVEAPWPQHRPQLIRFRARGVGNGSIQWSSAKDVEVQVQLDSAMLGVLPKGPGHTGKCAKDAAVHGGQIEQLARIGFANERHGLGCQFPEDLVEGLGVKQPRSLAKRAQRRRPNAQPTLNGIEGRSLLQGTEARNRGTKEVEQQEADILVVEQLAVASPITLGANLLESRQQGHQRVEILQALNVTRLQSSSAWSGHQCLHVIPEVLRVRMKTSRKYHAKPPCANLVPNSIGPGGWGGDWYVWHAPDGLRARAATRLGCVQAGAQKLGVIEASYAAAIIGVVDRPLFRREGTTQLKGLISTAWASISTEVWIESASWFQTARNSERSSSRRCKCMYIHSRSVRCAPTAQ